MRTPIHAPWDYDTRLKRTPPEITDLVTRARERCLHTPKEERDIESVIDTEINAVARAILLDLTHAATS